MTRTLYCATSGCVVTLSDFVPVCPTCARPTVWRTMPWVQKPQPKGLTLSPWDKRLLRQLRISPE